MLLSSVLAIVTLVAAPAAAHFKMTNPVPRGDREVTMDKAPCGGFDTPSRKRTCFGPKSTFSVDMTDKNAFMTIKLGSGPNPRSFPVQMSTRRFAEIGVYNFPADFSKVPKTFTNNSLATLQFSTTSGHGVCNYLTVLAEAKLYN
ncbi:hypothetical protein BSLG_010184 [Batrachochytrium salamandrivorans]|nr:hypothetical protein BSLG_010184 [Batrachochytrium salamandrivorans]